MRRWAIFLVVVGIITAVSLAGYLGYQSVQPAAEATPPPPVTVAVTQGDVAKTVTAPGQLVGTQEVVLGMDVNGRLAELNVRPGSIVQKGDVLARIDPQPYRDALQVAQIELAQAEADYQQQLVAAELATENSEAMVGSAQAQFPSLTAAEVNLQSAKDYEARAAYEFQKAQDRHWEPPEVVEAYRLEWVNAQNQVTLAQADYNAVQNQQWAVGQQVAALQTNVEQANSAAEFLQQSGVNPLLTLAVERAEKELAATELVAPFAGVVLELFVTPGEIIGGGSNVLLLTDPSQGEVRTTIIEEDLSLIELGQRAEIFFDGRPEISVAGFVSRVVPQRVIGEARPLYHVYIGLEDALPEGVVPGMTADASVTIAAESDVVRLPRALVRARSDGTAVVELWQGGERVSRDIRVGLRGDIFITILDGLSVGDEVVGE
ncbi:MAG: efflux RND transporter periplasmic adaptor subunit [Chloroflexota bacterium]